MTKISEIGSETTGLINLPKVFITKIYEARFVKTRFDKQKDESEGKLDFYYTGVREIVIEDDTGEIYYTEWSPKNDVKVGDELEFINARAKFDDYHDRFNINISKKKDNALCINRTALNEGRPDGEYLRKSNGKTVAPKSEGTFSRKPPKPTSKPSQEKPAEPPTPKLEVKKKDNNSNGLLFDSVGIIEAIQDMRDAITNLNQMIRNDIVKEISDTRVTLVQQFKNFMEKFIGEIDAELKAEDEPAKNKEE